MTKNAGPDWVQAPDGSWHQRVGPPPAAKKSGTSLGSVIVLICLVACGGFFGIALLGKNATTTTTTKPGVTVATTPPTTVDPAAAQAALDAELAKAQTPNPDAIVKDPDSVKGQIFLLAVEVTQYDASTGACMFRGHWDATAHEFGYEYKGDNAIFTAGNGKKDCPALEGVDAEDVVRVWAKSKGATSYDTQIGGTTTAPEFEVLKAEVVQKK